MMRHGPGYCLPFLTLTVSRSPQSPKELPDTHRHPPRVSSRVELTRVNSSVFMTPAVSLTDSFMYSRKHQLNWNFVWLESRNVTWVEQIGILAHIHSRFLLCVVWRVRVVAALHACQADPTREGHEAHNTWNRWRFESKSSIIGLCVCVAHTVTSA